MSLYATRGCLYATVYHADDNTAVFFVREILFTIRRARRRMIFGGNAVNFPEATSCHF